MNMGDQERIFNLWMCLFCGLMTFAASRKVLRNESSSHICWKPLQNSSHMGTFDVFEYQNQTSLRSTCYFLSNSRHSYNVSRQLCLEVGKPLGVNTLLVVVKNSEVNGYIADTLMGSRSDRFSPGVWLGLKWGHEGSSWGWRWEDGDLLEWSNNWGSKVNPSETDTIPEACAYIWNKDWVKGHCNFEKNPLFLCQWQPDEKWILQSTHLPSGQENSTAFVGHTRTFYDMPMDPASDDGVPLDNPGSGAESSRPAGFYIGIAVCVLFGIIISVTLIGFLILKRRKEKSNPPVVEDANGGNGEMTSSFRKVDISAPIFKSSTLVRPVKSQGVSDYEAVPMKMYQTSRSTGYLKPVQRESSGELTTGFSQNGYAKGNSSDSSDVYEDIPNGPIYEEPTLDVRGKMGSDKPPNGLVMVKGRPCSDYEDIDNMRFSRGSYPHREGNPLLAGASGPPVMHPKPRDALLDEEPDENLVIIDNELYSST